MDFRRGTIQGYGGSFPDLRTLLCNSAALRLFLLLSFMVHLSVMGAFSELSTGLLQGTTAGARSYTLVAQRSATAPGQQGEKQARESKTADKPPPAQQAPAPAREEQTAVRDLQQNRSGSAPARRPPAVHTENGRAQHNSTAPADELRALTLRAPPSVPASRPKRASKKPRTRVEKRDLKVPSGKRQPTASSPAQPVSTALPVAVAAQELTHLTLAAESEASKDQQVPSNEKAAAHVQRSDADGRARNAQDVAALIAPSSGTSFTPPRYQGSGLSNPMPRYPYVARVRGLQGRVLLRVAVSVAGKADTVSVHESSGHRALDRAALKAVRGWRFTPGMLGTETVAGQITVPVVFRLK